jgi:hypothetical protein
VNALHLPPYVAAAFARMDAAEAERDRREQIDRQIEAEDRRAAAAMDAQRFELHHGYTVSELFQHRSAAQDAAEARDAAAEYGSERRPEILIDGEALPAREQAARAQQPTEAQRLDARLERAYAATRDPFMRRMREEWHRREVARAQRSAYSEITRDTSQYDR